MGCTCGGWALRRVRFDGWGLETVAECFVGGGLLEAGRLFEEAPRDLRYGCDALPFALRWVRSWGEARSDPMRAAVWRIRFSGGLALALGSGRGAGERKHTLGPHSLSEKRVARPNEGKIATRLGQLALNLVLQLQARLASRHDDSF